MKDCEYSEEFNAWFSKTYPLGNLERTTEEVLRKMIASQAWEASRSMLVISLPAIRAEDYCPLSNVAYREECREVLEAAGLKVKPC